MKYGMIIDLDKCVGCRACVMACKAEWGLQDDKSRCWVKPVGPEEVAPGELGMTFYVGQCNHCDNPSCISECPTSATYKDPETGLVLVDKELCIGCGNCIVACPYGARFNSLIDKKVEKCTFCDGRIQQGQQPACVQTCPTEARIFGNLEDPNSEVSKHVFQGSATSMDIKEGALKPNIYYEGKNINLLFNKHQPEKVETSLSNQIWSSVSPLVNLALGGTIIGVIGAFVHQLITGEKEEESHE